MRHENAILCSGARPPSEQDHELQVVYCRLSNAEHGWNHTRMLLDITREEVETRTHGIIHLEHHMEVQDTELDEHHGAKRQQPQHQERDSSYLDFLTTHLPIFSDVTNPLEADSWLRTIESKFGLLHYTEYQKTLYAMQRLRGTTGAWWASYIVALPADHHVPWGEFYTAFHAHHLSVGLLHLQEHLVQFTSLLYNELVSAAIDQERMMNAVAKADDKKRKRMMPGSTSSDSSSGAPPKYRMVYTPHGVSCVDHNNSRIGAVAHNCNHGNSSSSS
jgi:hypothetical protein